MSFNARTRQIIYVVATIAGLAKTWMLTKGWIDSADAAFIAGAVTLVTGLAAAKTGDPSAPAAYTPRHADDGDPTYDDGDHLQVIPAGQATSDTKADAAGTL